MKTISWISCSMRYGILFVVSFLMWPHAATACDFCSSSTVLSTQRAICFEAIFDDRIERLKQSGRGFVQVDLDSCDTTTSSGNRGTAGEVFSDRSEAYAEGALLILTEIQMYCLRNSVEELRESLDPELLVEITQDCALN